MLQTSGRLTLSFDKFLKIYLLFQEYIFKGILNCRWLEHRARILVGWFFKNSLIPFHRWRVWNPRTFKGLPILLQLSIKKRQTVKNQNIQNLLNYILKNGCILFDVNCISEELVRNQCTHFFFFHWQLYIWVYQHGFIISSLNMCTLII